MSATLPSYWERLSTTPLHELLRSGATGSLDWRTAIRAAELPEPIADTIHAVVRGTRLWRSERRAVAEELIAHFEDGLERRATADELVTSFGDPATAARLIRRAKRRGRPVIWQAWWWGSRVALVAAVAYVGLGAYLLTAAPTIDTDYLARLNSPLEATPEAERAWPVYERLLLELDDRLGPPSEDERRRDPHPAPLTRLWARYELDSYEKLAPDRRAKADAWLQANADWLNELRSAAARPVFGIGMLLPHDTSPTMSRALGWPLYENDQRAGPDEVDYWDGWVFRGMLPHQELRTLARLIEFDFQYAHSIGDSRRAADDLVAQWGLARHAEESPLVLGALIGAAIRSMAIETLEESLTGEAAEAWTDADLLRLAHTLAEPPRPLLHHLNGELLAMRDTIQRMYVAGGGVSLRGLRGFAREIDDDYSLFDMPDNAVALSTAKLLFAPVVWTWIASESETTAQVERLHRLAVQEAATPLWEQPISAEDAYFDLVHREPQHAVLGLFGHGYRHTIEHARRTTAKVDGALLGVALELFRRDNGEWPATLAELAPRWIPAVPVDPITGGSLGYTLVDGAPVVYSLGRDGDDDGGRLPAIMDDAANADRGHVTVQRYRIGPPLEADEWEKPQPHARDRRDWYDGDWVLWSLAPRRYMEAVRGEGVGE